MPFTADRGDGHYASFWKYFCRNSLLDDTRGAAAKKVGSWSCPTLKVPSNKDMLKQRKMAHITVIGPLLGIVQAQVKSFLKERSAEGILGMLTSFKGLFGDNESPIYLSYSIQERDMFHGQKSKTAEEDIGEGIMMNCKRLDQFEGKHGSLAGVKTRAESAINDIAAYLFSCKKQKPKRKQRKDTKIPSSSGEPIADEAANKEHVPEHSNDPLLSGKDRLKLNELMELCTQLQNRVLDLENTKTTQAQEITSLKKRVNKLERRKKSRTYGLKRLYKVGLSAKIISSKDEGLGDQEDASKQGRKIDEIDQDTEVTLFDETQGRYSDNLMFDTGVLDNEEVFIGQDMAKKEVDMAKKDVSTADPVTIAGDVVTTASVEIPDKLALAQTLIEIESAKPKAVTTAATTAATIITPVSTRPRAKGIVFHDQEEQAPASTPIVSSSQSSQIKYKGKGIMVEKPKKMQMKDQVLFDKQELNLMRKTGLQEKRKKSMLP
ncbi:hypothetical protein Tco_0293975 [Tanacetum coccineum]